MQNQQTSGKKVIFPEGSGLIINDLVEKYNLKDVRKEKIEKMKETESPEERERIAEELPGRKIAKLVKRVAENKISLASLASELENQLSLKSGDAKSLAEELKEKLLNNVKELTETSTPPPTPEPEKNKKPDVYREEIE